MFRTPDSDREMMGKKQFGKFLLSQITNFVLIIVFFLEDFFGGLQNHTTRHWIEGALILVIAGNLVAIIYLFYKGYGKRSESKKKPIT